MFRNRTNRGGTRGESVAAALMEHQNEQNDAFMRQQDRMHADCRVDFQDSTSAFKEDSAHNRDFMRAILSQLADTKKSIDRLVEASRSGQGHTCASGVAEEIILPCTFQIQNPSSFQSVCNSTPQEDCVEGVDEISTDPQPSEEPLADQQEIHALPVTVSLNIHDRPKRPAKRKAPYTP